MNGVTADKGSHAWVSFIGQFVITVKATVPLTTQRFRMVLPALSFTKWSQRNGTG
uniref:Uncharacterized protein n=1 Tax=Raoultella planticola TaxID=575 RepID=W8CTV7_RAOPL|nr:hypothetical protein pKpNDM1_00051 [Raoultella planticola]UGK55170.1 Hypothetical protein [Raoultella ornithinolytica]